MSVNLFYSYCHSDEIHRENMEKSLVTLRENGVLDEWSDNEIQPGEVINDKIDSALESSDIVVFLISVDFLNSAACKEEWNKAKIRAKEHDTRLISIILRPCAWTDFDDMKNRLAFAGSQFPDIWVISR
ncbi:MAG: toll/interleukin-1 receptor domain-containing protein [Pseudomonadales bacterium]|nr:toll/interleukin-1 receptor domain-containing protein [Pseudomonadales bacterium]